MYSLLIKGECDYWQRNLYGNMMREADLHLVPRLRMNGATLALSNMPYGMFI
jgi:hypothetical protein